MVPPPRKKSRPYAGAVYYGQRLLDLGRKLMMRVLDLIFRHDSQPPDRSVPVEQIDSPELRKRVAQYHSEKDEGLSHGEGLTADEYKAKFL